MIVSGLNHLAQSKKYYAGDKKKNTSLSDNVRDNGEGAVINFFDESDGPLWYVANNDKIESGVVKIYSHASQYSINGMYTTDEIKAYLYKNSPTWKKFIDSGGKLTLKAYACNFGRIDGLGQQLSNQSGLTVIAASNYWTARGFSWFGWDSGVESPGKWMKYNNGKEIK